MPGIVQSNGYIWQDAFFLSVNQSFEMCHGEPCVFNRVQGFDRFQAFTRAFPVFPLYILLIQKG